MTLKWQVRTGWSNANANVISDLLELQMSVGRRNLLDGIQVTTATFRFRRTTANNTALTGLKNRDQLTLQFTGNDFVNRKSLANLRVVDVQFEYGNPSGPSEYNQDFCTVTAEGALGTAGRYNRNADTGYGTVNSQAATINTLYGMDFDVTSYDTYRGINSYYLMPFTGSLSLADWLNQVANSTAGRVDDTLDGIPVAYPIYYNQAAGFSFTDTTPASTALIYQQIQYASQSVVTYDYVLISIDGPIPVAAMTATATEPYQALYINSVLADVYEAVDYANALIYLYKDADQIPYSITAISNGQHTEDHLAQAAQGAIGTVFDITFRGTTTSAICEGYELSAQPGSTQFTYYFSTPKPTEFFILNDTNQGVLDTNRLGF